MSSSLVTQAEIHALLYAGYNSSVEFGLSHDEPGALTAGKAFRLSTQENPYLESPGSVAFNAPSFYLPLDPMVINCADPAMNRFAEVGITLQVRDAKGAEAVEKIKPSLRNAILIMLSQKTSDELLSRHGKEKLVIDMLSEVDRVFMGKQAAPQPVDAMPSMVDARHPKNHAINPVLEVLFSSLIVHQAAS